MPPEGAAAAPAAAPSSSPSSSSGSNGAPASGQSAGQPASPSGNGTAAPAAPAAEPKYFERTLKMNGKEVPVKASEEELWNAYRHHESLNQRARTMAEQEKKWADERSQWEAKQKALLEDPFLLRREQDPNFDPIDEYTRQLHALLERQQMDPRARAILEREEQLKAREAEVEAFHTKQAEAAQLETDRAELNQLGSRFMRVLSMAKLPKDDVTLNLLYQQHQQAQADGLDLGDEELAKATFDAVVAQQESILDKYQGEALLDTFPKLARKVHEALLARFKAQQGQSANQQPVEPRMPAAPQLERRKTESELHAEEEKRLGRRILRTI